MFGGLWSSSVEAFDEMAQLQTLTKPRQAWILAGSVVCAVSSFITALCGQEALDETIYTFFSPILDSTSFMPQVVLKNCNQGVYFLKYEWSFQFLLENSIFRLF